MTEAIILDICGTLSNNAHRMHLCPKGDQDKVPEASWAAFMAPDLVAQDGINLPVWWAVKGLMLAGLRPIIITGRSDALRETTATWIAVSSQQAAVWLPSDPHRLLMRPLGDRRPSHEVKREHLLAIRAQGFRPTIAFDDRASDAAMYREEGLFVFHVAEGRF